MYKIFSLLLLSLAFSNQTLAQDFEVGPVKMMFSCEGGQIETKMLMVRNHATEKQQFVLTLGMPNDTIGQKNKIKIERSCKDWITLSPAFFDLNPNESKEIKVVMQVPPGHSETRWCDLYVVATEEQSSIGADKQTRAGVKVRPRITVKIFQSPKSNSNYKGRISDLKEISKAKDTLRTFQVNISNIGDKLLDGKVYLIASNLETAKEIKNTPKLISVLPGEIKQVPIDLPRNIPSGKYSLAAILDYGNNSSLEAVQINIEVK